MLILGIDPGEMTGVALGRINHPQDPLIELSLLYSVAFEWDIEERSDFALLRGIILNFKPDHYVLEREPSQRPYRNQQHKVQTVLHLIQKLVGEEKCTIYSPGDWKPVARAQEWKYKSVTSHEKDALNLVRYHVLRSYRKVVVYDED